MLSVPKKLLLLGGVGLVWFWFFVCFEMGFLYAALTVLELALETKLVSNSQHSTYLYS